MCERDSNSVCTIAVSLARKDGVANDSACSRSLSRQSAASSEAVEAAAATTPTAKQATCEAHTHTQRQTETFACGLNVVRWRWLRSCRRQRIDSAVDVTLLLACSARFGFSSFSYVVHAERKSGQSAPTHSDTHVRTHTHTHLHAGRETNQYRSEDRATSSQSALLLTPPTSQSPVLCLCLSPSASCAASSSTCSTHHQTRASSCFCRRRVVLKNSSTLQLELAK